MDIHIRIRFEYGCHMDVFKSDFQYYPNSILSELFDKNLTYPTLSVCAKIKYPLKLWPCLDGDVSVSL
jgi:hypothetical protein